MAPGQPAFDTALTQLPSGLKPRQNHPQNRQCDLTAGGFSYSLPVALVVHEVVQFERLGTVRIHGQSRVNIVLGCLFVIEL